MGNTSRNIEEDKKEFINYLMKQGYTLQEAQEELAEKSNGQIDHIKDIK